MKKVLFVVSLLLVAFCCFSQSRYVSQTTKKIVYTRDGGICQCCGSSQSLEYDHITPFSCGGSSAVSNIQLLCKPCNRSKSNSCVCKVHDKRVGTNCCDKKTTLSAASMATNCPGTTKNGARIKKRTNDSSGRCHFHQ
ncbi:MAG: HNH endonuclease [Flavobacterium sp.]